MKKIHSILMVFALLLIVGAAGATAEPYKILTGLELKAMLDRNEPGLVVVDTRTAAEYGEAHIKGAVSIPLNVMASNPSIMQYPLTERIVFYCNGFT